MEHVVHNTVIFTTGKKQGNERLWMLIEMILSRMLLMGQAPL